MNFSKNQAKQLESLLDLENYPESLGYEECHGFLCGLACGPVKLSMEQKLARILFDEQTLTQNNVIDHEILELIKQLDNAICQTLLSSNTILLPCVLTLRNSTIDESLENWLQGFFEAHLLDEAAWYEPNEELVAEMLIPFLAGFTPIESNDLTLIRSKPELLQSLLFNIPQALQDLYLFFSLGEHKPEKNN